TGTCWPGAGNTGVPAGTVLSAYTGPCTITTPSTVINAKTISCDLTIQAAGVTISNSQINGTVSNEGSDAAFTVTDSTINATPGATRQVTGIQSSNYTATRVNVTGGNRGMYCSSNCTILDSYVHGQKIQDNWHASAIRFEQDTHVTHNTIVCDAPVQPDPEGSCSASLTGYPDFAIIHDVYINHNLFPPTQYAAFCAYGGSTNGKTYSGQSYNVSFTNNIFTKGPTPDNQYCALYGPISDFDQTRPGMVWQNNKWNDGEVITP
ncbi:MAG TPA: hypothetical protein VLF67_01750, partial [Candidatus Saccharimonas sp.]|nr:hypothetical protein [Candidatus Saccharimonas sp.]